MTRVLGWLAIVLAIGLTASVVAGTAQQFDSGELWVTDPTPGMGNDEPDALIVRGNILFVSLRASGQLAIVKVNQQTVKFLQLSPPAPFNPQTCGPSLPEPPTGQGGCAIHGVTVRP